MVFIIGDITDPVAVEKEKATALYGVPTMFIAELAHPMFDMFDLTSLRTGIMAGSWLSSKWPDRAPEGYVLVRAFLGGARDPDAISKSDAGPSGAAREWEERKRLRTVIQKRERRRRECEEAIGLIEDRIALIEAELSSDTIARDWQRLADLTEGARQRGRCKDIQGGARRLSSFLSTSSKSQYARKANPQVKVVLHIKKMPIRQ